MRDIYLLKFGGNALDGAEGLRRLAHEVADLVEKGIAIVMVHGGGPAISAEMERLGMQPRKVAGVRVTDEAGLEVAEKVLRQINGEVVAALEEAKRLRYSVEDLQKMVAEVYNADENPVK
jgi:acetylglutamate kinase